MACFYPLGGCSDGNGGVRVFARSDRSTVFLLPCGRCHGCRLEYARQWTVRLMHEGASSDENAFITLTYDDDHIPLDGSLRYSDFRSFLKRFRERVRKLELACDLVPRRIRFFMCGEYGVSDSGGLGRPHFHAIIFGWRFPDRKYWRTSEAGSKSYRSAFLESLWTFGSSELGDLTQESAAYVSRYVMKKISGDAADQHYRDLDKATGELTWRVPEFTHMSLKPGIGAKWFERFHSDVYPHDRVVVKGRLSKPPRYYDKLMGRLEPELIEAIKETRKARARDRQVDNTPERLIVREAVSKGRLSFFRRKLK